MAPMKGYYGLIQYLPDPARAEAANVGVLLFCPEVGFLQAKTASGNDRVRRFFGGNTIDPERLNAAKEAIISRLNAGVDAIKTAEDLVRFTETRFNELRVTGIRPMRVENPAKDLGSLFSELVGGRSRRKEIRRPFQELDDYFRGKDLTNLIKFKVSAEIPILNRTIMVPYAYNNGALHLIQPHLFGTDPQQNRVSAATLAVQGNLIRRHGNERDGIAKRLVVVSGFKNMEDTESRSMVRSLFREYEVRQVEREEIPGFVEEVARTAHL